MRLTTVTAAGVEVAVEVAGSAVGADHLGDRDRPHAHIVAMERLQSLLRFFEQQQLRRAARAQESRDPRNDG